MDKQITNMNKRTVIISKINEDHTAYVMNYGIDELALFKKLPDNGLELKNKELLSDGELLMLMRALCTDGFVETVISIENHYNRDQKQINIYKTNIEQNLKAKGCTIINHCDWKPSFDNEPPIINKRNYLTILNENINKKERELSEKTAELDELCDEIEETKEYIKNQKKKIDLEIEQHRNNLEKELKEQEEKTKEYVKNQKKKIDLEIEQHRNNLEKELKEQEEEKQRNSEKIKNQNWYIQETTPKYDKLKTDFDKLKTDFNKLTERYKNGTKICENLLNEAKEKWPEELKKLEENINKRKSELLLLDERHNEKLNNIIKLDDEIKDKEAEKNKLNKIIINVKENGYNVIEKIFKQIKGTKELEDELKEKLKRTCKMYLLNGRNVPEFELEYFREIGLSEEIIQEIIKIFN